MKDEHETRKRLQESARIEFLEKGFMKASLRNICKNAGVTTGALYFFFKDKNDLFASLVEEPLQKVINIMQEHYQSEKNEMDTESILHGNSSKDLECANQILHVMYAYREEFLLLITKAQGSEFEQVFDKIVVLGEQHYRTLFDAAAKYLKKKPMPDVTVHYLAHSQTEVFTYLITHVETEEEALKNMEQMVLYMLGGWRALLGI